MRDRLLKGTALVLVEAIFFDDVREQRAKKKAARETATKKRKARNAHQVFTSPAKRRKTSVSPPESILSPRRMNVELSLQVAGPFMASEPTLSMELPSPDVRNKTTAVVEEIENSGDELSDKSDSSSDDSEGWEDSDEGEFQLGDETADREPEDAQGAPLTAAEDEMQVTVVAQDATDGEMPEGHDDTAVQMPPEDNARTEFLESRREAYKEHAKETTLAAKSKSKALVKKYVLPELDPELMDFVNAHMRGFSCRLEPIKLAFGSDTAGVT